MLLYVFMKEAQSDDIIGILDPKECEVVYQDLLYGPNGYGDPTLLGLTQDSFAARFVRDTFVRTAADRRGSRLYIAPQERCEDAEFRVQAEDATRVAAAAERQLAKRGLDRITSHLNGRMQAAKRIIAFMNQREEPSPSPEPRTSDIFPNDPRVLGY